MLYLSTLLKELEALGRNESMEGAKPIYQQVEIEREDVRAALLGEPQEGEGPPE